MSVTYPLFVFEKDDKSIRLIDKETQILHHCEAIDIENDEYVFWDVNGAGVSVAVTSTTTFKTGKLKSVSSSAPAFPLRDAFKSYAESLGLSQAIADGEPIDAWRRIRAELERRPRKKGILSRLFSRD
ncbi:MAG TPA: hypothetical protein VJN89_15120 [Candidatus Acidoferrum sp.]|nr:hypothetical protein [Candidatus Acidoferrum sp.]